MKTSLTQRISLQKHIIDNINYNTNSTQRTRNGNLSSIKTNFNTISEGLNSAWDFTPFPDLYFPSQKKEAIKKINKLNFKNNFRNIKIIDINKIHNKRASQIYINTNIPKKLFKSNSISNLFQENKGDITKRSSPAYSFGISREDCKFPMLRLNEKISPTPYSYNIRPLEGLGGSSLKFRFNKESLQKVIKKFVNPGPGQYNVDKCDIKNNGKIVLSDIKNSMISNFGKYEERKSNITNNSEWNMKPEPASYNINNTLTMFTGNGIYPLSKFINNISKSFGKYRSLSKNKIKFIYPGPGEYNHYSLFRNIY